MATRTPVKRTSVKVQRPAKSAAAKSVREKPLEISLQPSVKKSDKPAKIKLVRDSFTIPKSEYATLDQLKQRAAKSQLPSKKSEVLRAGLMALAGMGDAAFQAAMSAVPTLKTGRPKKV